MNILITLTVLAMANHLVLAENLSEGIWPPRLLNLFQSVGWVYGYPAIARSPEPRLLSSREHHGSCAAAAADYSYEPSTRAAKEPTKDLHPKSGVKVPPNKKPPANHGSTSTAGPVKDPSTKTDPKPNNVWIYNPSSQYAEQSANDIRPVILRPHISRTRIAKAHTHGIDPYFNKGYFEPFEKRPRPVTLVAFRKNGLIPHQNIEVHPRKSLEVAEMQSPYNNIGSFWQDDIGQS